jgi:MtN3 and saliva related transmembrane protein
MNKPWVEAIGWVSTAILLATLVRQVYTEWKSRTAAGLSKWLFTGQVAASLGFVAYSLLLGNWVFVGSNIAILGVAIVGQVLFLRKKRQGQTTE